VRHFNTMNDITNLCSTSSSPGNQVTRRAEDVFPAGRVIQNLAELVDPPRRRATIHIIDMKFDSLNEFCVSISLRIFVFRLICIVMTLVMQSFV